MTTPEAHKETLENIKNGLATKVRILVPSDACPACKSVDGAWSFEEVPELPLEGCSCRRGCSAAYEPVLDLFGP